MKITMTFLSVILLFIISCEKNLIENLRVAGNEDTEQFQPAGQVVLYPNSPNPFYPSTRIYFEISVSMYVRLEVYTDEWEKLDVLIDQYKEAGAHQISYYNENLPSGNYYYVLEAAGNRLIGTMKCVK